MKQSIRWEHIGWPIVITAIFAIRWATCLPFSGNMPAVLDGDNLDLFGRFLIFVREPFGYPVGRIEGLSFPFRDANIFRGSIPLVAIPLKALAKIWAPVGQHYFFVTAELIAVFVATLYVCKLLTLLKINSPWYKLIGSILLVLNPALLHRSSKYYTISFVVMNFPVIFAFFYYYALRFEGSLRRSAVGLGLLLPIAALFDYYLLFALLVVTSTLVVVDVVRYFWIREKFLLHSARSTAVALVAGAVLAQLCLKAIGDEGSLQSPERSQLWVGRYADGWAYGGGFGGGFHVADLLTFFIPPADLPDLPWSMRNGPVSIPVLLGFPFYFGKLMPGQYEGFAYLGTAMLISLILVAVVWLRSDNRLTLFRKAQEFHSGPWLALWCAAIVLFSISLGYVLHVAGHRFPSLPTPATLMAYVWPKFMYARSLGRLDFFLMSLVGLGVFVSLVKRVLPVLQRYGSWMPLSALAILATLHMVEVRGYLDPPASVSGNSIINHLDAQDQATVREVTRGKSALLVAPLIRRDLKWDMICYSLAFHSLAPLSGSTVGFGEKREHMLWFEADVNAVENGRFKDLRLRYGDFAVAVSPVLAQSILAKADLQPRVITLHHPGVVLLDISGPRGPK
ncbi:MAG: hypothetical protein JNM27_22475 [Leptospirales bacterium]|nr:hypothetical protein [Leptospirales bacterium]